MYSHEKSTELKAIENSNASILKVLGDHMLGVPPILQNFMEASLNSKQQIYVQRVSDSVIGSNEEMFLFLLNCTLPKGLIRELLLPCILHSAMHKMFHVAKEACFNLKAITLIKIK